MTKTNLTTAAAFSALLLGAVAATPALAQDEATSAWDVSGNASVVSDYRFRGVSLNTEDFAVQGGIDASYAINDSIKWYVGNWNSSLDSSLGYGSVEVDLYTGFTGSMGAATWKVGGIGYFYPDDSAGTDYFELQGELSGAAGPVTLAAGVFYAPSQDNYGGKDGVYLYSSASAGIPNTPLSVKATLGYEDNAFFNSKLDWSVGVSASWKMLTASVSYVDSNRVALYGPKPSDGADATIVGSIGVVF